MSSVIKISEKSYTAAEKIIKQEQDNSNSRNIQNGDANGDTKLQYNIRYHVDTSDICDQDNLSLDKFINFDYQGGNSQEISQYESMISMLKQKQNTLETIKRQYDQITGNLDDDNDPEKRKETEEQKYRGEKSARK